MFIVARAHASAELMWDLQAMIPLFLFCLSGVSSSSSGASEGTPSVFSWQTTLFTQFRCAKGLHPRRWGHVQWSAFCVHVAMHIGQKEPAIAKIPDDIQDLFRLSEVLFFLVKLHARIAQGIRLMHLCDYHYADVVLTLAYASVYFRSRLLNRVGLNACPAGLGKSGSCPVPTFCPFGFPFCVYKGPRSLPFVSRSRGGN